MFDWIAGALLLIAGGFALFMRGKAKGKKESEIEDVNEYIATRRRIEGAGDPGLSDAAVTDRLRKHAAGHKR